MVSKRNQMVESGSYFEIKVGESILSQSNNKVQIRFNYEFYSPRINRNTEIDVIAISPNRIYIIECKSYSNWIRGEFYDLNWKFCSSGKISTVQNPVLGNFKHLRLIKGLMYSNNIQPPKMENIIITPDSCKYNGTLTNVYTLSSFLGKLERDLKEPAYIDVKEISKNLDNLKNNIRRL